MTKTRFPGQSFVIARKYILTLEEVKNHMVTLSFNNGHQRDKRQKFTLRMGDSITILSTVTVANLEPSRCPRCPCTKGAARILVRCSRGREVLSKEVHDALYTHQE